jgi:general stress protein CsbA
VRFLGNRGQIVSIAGILKSAIGGVAIATILIVVIIAASYRKNKISKTLINEILFRGVKR